MLQQYRKVLVEDGYLKQEFGAHIDFFYKDAGYSYKIVLILQNYGKCRIVNQENLDTLKAKLCCWPVFLYNKPKEFLVIIAHAGKHDRVAFRCSNLVLIGADGSERFYGITNSFKEDVQKLRTILKERQLRKRCEVADQQRGYGFVPIITGFIITVCIWTFFSRVNIEAYGMRAEILENRQWPAFIAYAFLHADILHLLGNMISLAVIGGMLEKRIGSFRYTVLVALSIPYIGMISMLYKEWINSSTITVGFSGVLYAMLGVLIIYKVRNREKITFLSIYIGICLLKGLLRPDVDTMIHITGFLTGICAGIIYVLLGEIRIRNHKIQYTRYQIMRK